MAAPLEGSSEVIEEAAPNPTESDRMRIGCLRQTMAERSGVERWGRLPEELAVE